MAHAIFRKTKSEKMISFSSIVEHLGLLSILELAALANSNHLKLFWGVRSKKFLVAEN